MKNKIKGYNFMKVHWIFAFLVVVFISAILAFIGWVFYLFELLFYKEERAC